MNNIQQQVIADILPLNEQQIHEIAYELPDCDAVYCYLHEKGGLAIIVGTDGGYLLASSCISPMQHQQAYLEGKRSHTR